LVLELDIHKLIIKSTVIKKISGVMIIWDEIYTSLLVQSESQK